MSAVKRITMLLVVLIGVSIFSFALSAVSAVDPAEAIARAQIANASPELIESIREEYQLDCPIVERYFSWLAGVLRGDFGTSFMTRNAVSTEIGRLLPKTLCLAGFALLLTMLLSLPIGVCCARFHNKAADHVIRWLTVLGICIPVFWLGFLLLLQFAVKIPLFRVTPEPGIKGYILPAIALALPSLCSAVRLFRASLLNEMSMDYIAYYRSRGLGRGKVLMSHAFRNALPPLITLFASQAGALIAGSAIVESIFSIKGFGVFLIEAVIARDLPVISAAALVFAGIFVLLNLLAEIINRLLCPRIAAREVANA